MTRAEVRLELESLKDMVDAGGVEVLTAALALFDTPADDLTPYLAAAALMYGQMGDEPTLEKQAVTVVTIARALRDAERKEA